MSAKTLPHDEAQHLHEHEKPSAFTKAMAHVLENPTTYAAGVLIVVLVLFAGMMWKGLAAANDRNVMSDYAKALVQTEDPAIRATELGRLAEGASGRWAPEIVYMAAEAAAAQGMNDKAEQGFQRVLAEFGKSEFASRAADGLGFLAENKGDNAAALQKYTEVATQYPDTLTGRLVYNKIGRVQEALGNPKAALEAYTKQGEVFPDSLAATAAAEAAERLKSMHPELADAPVAPAETPAPAAEAPAAEATPAAAPAPEAPAAAAETTPATEAPAADAPAAAQQ